MHSYRQFLLTGALIAAPFFTSHAPLQAQTQVTQNGVIYQSTTRPQVFKESNAMSGSSTLRWGNDDRDTDRDRNRDRNRDGNYDRDGRRDHHNGGVPVGSACAPGSNTVIVPVYPGYGAYPGYGVPSYPYGSSVTISTPGYNDGMFNVFPWTTTVTTYGTGPAVPNYVVPNYYGYRNYPSYPAYPAYPTYVPGNIQGYRGAATPGYIYNGGSFPSGAFITGSTNGYSTNFGAGYSNGRTSITIGGHR